MALDEYGRPKPDPQQIRKKGGIPAAIKAGKEIASLAGKVHELPDGLPYTLVPEGMEIKPLRDFLLEAPLRLRARPFFLDAESFSAYVVRFKLADTVIFADRANNRFVGVIDYHGPDLDGGEPSWCDHVATLQLQTSPEWQDWSRQNTQSLGQEAFANFLEDHIGQVVLPEGKVLLDAILKIRLVRVQSTRAVRNLSTGEVQLAYTDEETGDEANSKMPTELELLLRYFRGQDAFRMKARLRYRPQGSSVAFSYLINDLDKLQETCFQEVCTQIAEATECPVYQGTYQ